MNLSFILQQNLLFVGGVGSRDSTRVEIVFIGYFKVS